MRHEGMSGGTGPLQLRVRAEDAVRVLSRGRGAFEERLCRPRTTLAWQSKQLHQVFLGSSTVEREATRYLGSCLSVGIYWFESRAVGQSVPYCELISATGATPRACCVPRNQHVVGIPAGAATRPRGAQQPGPAGTAVDVAPPEGLYPRRSYEPPLTASDTALEDLLPASDVA